MRVVLLLTVGLPVFAAQLVAFALPRVEAAPIELLRRVAQTTERREIEAKIISPARPLPSVFALQLSADQGFIAAAPAPAGSRALIFVKHVRRQAS